MEGRNRQTGRFEAGNPGGPGRPRRSVESDYLRALSEACPLDMWQEVAKAVTDAKAGDAQARAWLGRYLMGAGTLGDSLNREERADRMFEEI